MTKTSDSPQLKVLFDTCVLYTSRGSDLLNREVAQLIADNSDNDSLLIRWCMPEVVRTERRYQMITKSLELLPSIRKLEMLLGHCLNINEATVEHQVDDIIDEHVEKHGIMLCDVNVEEVDWPRVIEDAMYRRAPFEAADNEKGFRDALIAETFMQVVASSSSTAHTRIALVTEDQLLRRALEPRAKAYPNVRIVSDLEQLKSLINALSSSIEEEFVARLQERAAKLFHDSESHEGLYYSEDIEVRMKDRFGDQLEETPDEATRRRNGAWTVLQPRFVKKEAERVHWASRVSVPCEALKYETRQYMTFSTGLSTAGLSPGGLTLGLNPGTYVGGVSDGLTVWGEPGAYAGRVPGFAAPLVQGRQTPVVVARGTTLFDVQWSVCVNEDLAFSHPEICRFDFVRTSWD